MNHQTGAFTRRRALLTWPVAALTLGVTPSVFANAPVELRIGYQKYGTLIILKARGNLEMRLASSGVEVRWSEFPAGPQLLEGLNVGSIDFGTVGEAPPIFAQAAGADIVYVGNEPPSPSSEAIVVQANSPIRNVAELRRKKIALNRGSNVHYLLMRVLEHAGIAYGDVETVFLPPADARAAFERGSVDAWAIWDPFLAAVQQQIGARTIADGTGLVKNHQFYLAARPYAEHHPQIVRAVLEELAKIDEWGRSNPREVAAFLGPQIGLSPPVVEIAARRYSYGVVPVDESVLAEQQRIADAFTELKLIPKHIAVRDATFASTTAQR